MHIAENTPEYRGQQILSIVAGWQPAQHPAHHALEREAAEAIDIAERDHAARAAIARRVEQ